MKLKQIIEMLENKNISMSQLDDNINDIIKYLKAMEIVKNKLSAIGRYSFLPMSLEEFNLLTEVLDDECRTDD